MELAGNGVISVLQKMQDKRCTTAQRGHGMQTPFCFISGAADDRQLDVDMCDAVEAEHHPEPASPQVRMPCCDY